MFALSAAHVRRRDVYFPRLDQDVIREEEEEEGAGGPIYIDSGDDDEEDVVIVVEDSSAPKAPPALRDVGGGRVTTCAQFVRAHLRLRGRWRWMTTGAARSSSSNPRSNVRAWVEREYQAITRVEVGTRAGSLLSWSLSCGSSSSSSSSGDDDDLIRACPGFDAGRASHCGAHDRGADGVGDARAAAIRGGATAAAAPAPAPAAIAACAQDCQWQNRALEAIHDQPGRLLLLLVVVQPAKRTGDPWQCAVAAAGAQGLAGAAGEADGGCSAVLPI